MTVRMRSTRSHTGQRRSHHALEPLKISHCTKCGSDVLPHVVCRNCGMYRGKELIDVLKKLTKKERKKKEKELKEKEEAQLEGKPLSAEELSQR